MIALKETPTRLLISGRDAEIEQLALDFRYHPTNYFRADSYQIYKMSGGHSGWDGYHYPLLRTGIGKAEILRGFRDQVEAACTKLEIAIDWMDSEVLDSPFTDLTAESIDPDVLESPYPLDLKQREAVAQWLNHGMGIAHFSMNAGKTLTFGAAAATIQAKYKQAEFLYLTPAERLVSQTYKEMKQALPGWDIGQFGGGKKNLQAKHMVVCTTAMLSRHFDQLLEMKWFHRFHALLLDECHHVAAPTIEKVLRACPAYFRLGASASLKEADPERHHKIIGLCGPVRCTVTAGELIDAGRSATPHIYVVDVPSWKQKFKNLGVEPDPFTPAWTLIDGRWQKATYISPEYVYKRGKLVEKIKRQLIAGEWVKEKVPMVEAGFRRLKLPDGTLLKADTRFTLLQRRYDVAIIQFRERNAIIKQWTEFYACKMQWNTLIIATRTAHILILQSILAPMLGDKLMVLTGDATSRQRDRTFEAFKVTPGAVLISSVVKEGVSINEIKAGIIADPIADVEVAEQAIGRFIRRKEDNHAHITMFVDRQHTKYYRNALQLMGELEKRRGYKFYYPVNTPDDLANQQPELL